MNSEFGPLGANLKISYKNCKELFVILIQYRKKTLLLSLHSAHMSEDIKDKNILRPYE